MLALREKGSLDGRSLRRPRGAPALEDLRDRLLKALDDAVKPVEKIHEDRKALVEMWGGERDRDPAFREKVFGGGRAG